jgi:sulfatase maturation enzyme AslB (radical SAM superfamily)
MFYDTIKILQIENSSLCNAACPQCVREWKNSDYSFFKQTFIPTDFFKNRIPQYIYDGLERINFSGSVGDPCMAPNLIDVVNVIREKNPNIEIQITTNGGMRTPNWWQNLAKSLGKTKHYVIFGIDGLEDTNHIYRVKVKWRNLMDNIDAFIQAGGVADWQFIPFKHNQHQITSARMISQTMGFRNFFLLASNRFMTEELFEKKSFGSDGKQLIPPMKEYQFNMFQDDDRPTSDIKWATQAEKNCIKCQAQEDREIFIDVETHLFPCCMTAGARLTMDAKDQDGFEKLWLRWGGDNIKLDINDWDMIVNGRFFSMIQRSWNKKFSEGRLIPCSASCSVGNSNYVGVQTVQFFVNPR